jgi:hypothetical protein
VLVVLLIGVAVYFCPAAVRPYRVIHFYDEDQIADNFVNMKEIVPVATVRAPATALPLERASSHLEDLRESSLHRQTPAIERPARCDVPRDSVPFFRLSYRPRPCGRRFCGGVPNSLTQTRATPADSR